MKKLRLSLFAMSAAMLLSAASCKKDKGEAVVPVSGGESFTAVAECQAGDAKTGLQGLDVVWSQNDEIVVFDADNHGAVFALSEGAGTASGKFTKDHDLVPGEGTAFDMSKYPFKAFYPADATYSSDGKYHVNVPSEQSYNMSGGFSKDTNPMAAYSESTSLQFHNLCGVMKLTLKGLGAVKSVSVVGSDNETVSGGGTVDFTSPNQPLLTMAGGDGSGDVKVDCGSVRLNEEDGVDFYVVMPANYFTNGFDVKVGFSRDDVFTQTAPPSSQVVNSVKAGRIREMPAFFAKGFPGEEEVQAAESFVGGNDTARFSVSATEQVYFSKGNLQYNPSGNKWQFAENQFDTLIGHNINDVGTQYNGSYNGWIDLFGFGTSGNQHGAGQYMPYSTVKDNGQYYAYGDWHNNLDANDGSADWGYNAIGNGGDAKRLWRTPTSAEWEYIFDISGNTGRRKTGVVDHAFLKVKVTPKAANTGKGEKLTDSINGILVFPDRFNKWNLLSGDAPYDVNDNGFTTVVESSVMQPRTPAVGGAKDETTGLFEQLQEAGVVFLPCAGFRDGAAVKNVGSHGCYWSSTAVSSTDAYYLLFVSGNVAPAVKYYRSLGFPVRLVCSRR